MLTRQRRQTADEMALDLLLEGDEEGLRKLSLQAKKALNNEIPCPECGDEGPHDDNGETGVHMAFCCRKCGCHFDAQPI